MSNGKYNVTGVLDGSSLNMIYLVYDNETASIKVAKINKKEKNYNYNKVDKLKYPFPEEAYKFYEKCLVEESERPILEELNNNEWLFYMPTLLQTPEKKIKNPCSKWFKLLCMLFLTYCFILLKVI